MKITEARKLLKKWQAIMGLGPWKITVEWGSIEGAHGNVEFDCMHRLARICVNRPNTLTQPITVEYVIVHELTHLVLHELELVAKAKPDQKELVLERVVNQLTSAFLAKNTHV